jgi:hypothetical protein
VSDVAKDPDSIAKDPAGALKGLGGIASGKAEQAKPSGKTGHSSSGHRANPR